MSVDVEDYFQVAAFKGQIDPDDWSVWWAHYDEFITYFLDIANRAGVDRFVVGSELNSTEPQIEQWRRIIARVRGSFSGEVAYASNWDRYDLVDQTPVLRPLAAHAFFGRAENIRQITADLAFVGNTRQAARARKHGEQRNLWQRDG